MPAIHMKHEPRPEPARAQYPGGQAARREPTVKAVIRWVSKIITIGRK